MRLPLSGLDLVGERVDVFARENVIAAELSCITHLPVTHGCHAFEGIVTIHYNHAGEHWRGFAFDLIALIPTQSGPAMTQIVSVSFSVFGYVRRCANDVCSRR